MQLLWHWGFFTVIDLSAYLSSVSVGQIVFGVSVSCLTGVIYADLEVSGSNAGS